MVKKRRAYIMSGVVLVLMLALCAQLFNLQVRSGAALYDESQTIKGKPIVLKGTRGKILDCNLLPLAYDTKCYNVEFLRDPTQNKQEQRKAYTAGLLRVIELVEAGGGVSIGGFAIVLGENGEMIFDFATEDEELAAKREKKWRENFYISKRYANSTPKEIFDMLWSYYQVPEDVPLDMKLKVMACWQEMQDKTFLAIPIVIARNVDFETAAKIEALTMEMPGISISDSTMRVYPRGSLASHVIGYTSKINANQLEQYKLKGYAADDLVGVTGIEKTMEDQLTGNVSYRKGLRIVERNAKGKIVRQLGKYQAPVAGHNIVLTLDSALQKVASDALEENIRQIRALQEDLIDDPAWLAKKDGGNAREVARYAEENREVAMAESGAVVVMDVKTGKVLAMDSCPSYDLSLFQGGSISAKDLQAILDDERKPMFNRAISARDTPGSIFKMVTGLAAMAEGKLLPTEQIDDLGPFDKYDKSKTGKKPHCWAMPNYGQHVHQTIVEGLSNSCNYYFFTAADRIGISTLYSWAGKLGLTTRTGIELPMEEASVVASQQNLYDATKSLTDQGTAKPRLSARKIREILVSAGEAQGLEYEAERLDRMVESLLNLTTLDDKTLTELQPMIRSILLEEMGLPSDFIAKRAMVTSISNYLREIKWNPTETLQSGIGQSIHQLTPISVARYISALANGGIVYEAQLVDRIINANGEVVTQKQPTIVSELGVSQELLNYIKKGMKDSVVMNEDGHIGTANDMYSDFKYREDIGVKTGTAQKSDIDLENNSWHVIFAPYEDPEIAVVVYIPNGLAGKYGAITTRAIVGYYLDQKELRGDELPPLGQFSP